MCHRIETRIAWRGRAVADRRSQLFIYFIRETTPSIPRGMQPSKYKRNQARPSSVPSAITFRTHDSSRNFTSRRSHLGLASNTRTLPGVFPCNASALAARSLAPGQCSKTCERDMRADAWQNKHLSSAILWILLKYTEDLQWPVRIGDTVWASVFRMLSRPDFGRGAESLSFRGVYRPSAGLPSHS
jgi:hypothetical protein